MRLLRTGLLGLLFFVLLGPVQAITETQTTITVIKNDQISTPETVLLIMGDSLSASYGIPADKSWVSLLDNRITEQKLPVVIVNKSISGTTTQNAAERFNLLLNSIHPTMVLLAVGSNDGLRGVSPVFIKKNLEQMILECQLEGIKVILVGFMVPPNYGPTYTEQFKAVFPQLAAKYNVPFIPFLLEGIADKPQYFLPDGVHPNEIAQPIILENVWAVLGPLLK